MTSPISRRLAERLTYRPIVDHPPFLWPKDALVAIWLVPNIEYYPPNLPAVAINERAAATSPDILNHTWREYGARVGFWRLLACVDELCIPVSATLNSLVCEYYPRLVEEGKQRSWEWIGHGRHNAERLSGISELNERDIINESIDVLTQFTGNRPRGWLGPGLGETERTPDILAQHSIDYVCDWVADDIPYYLDTEHGPLLAMPYSIELNDMELILRQHMTGPEYRQRIRDQFDQLIREASRERKGRVMALPVHPFLVGQAHRIGYLSDALVSLSSKSGAWFARGSEIADAYKAATR